METLKSYLRRYAWLIIILGLIAVGIAVYNIGGAYHRAQFDRTVNNQTNQANTAVKEAVNAQNAAVNAEVTRNTEDAVREKVINPRIDETRRQSKNSKAEHDAAKRQYKNAQNPTNLNNSVADNCSELARLYPDINFQYCHER